MSRYYLAIADLQAGRKKEGLAALKGLLADLPPNVPVRAAIEKQVAALSAGVNGQSPAPSVASASGPSAEAVRERMRAMRNASPQERMAMIRNMVEGLDARLKDNPNDLAGWLRLIRARKVLGETEKAKDALARARQAFSGDAEALRRIDSLAAQLGLSS